MFSPEHRSAAGIRCRRPALGSWRREERSGRTAHARIVLLGPLELDSLVRFDELQTVAESNLEPSGYTLNDELITILKSQLCFLLTGLAGEAFQECASELKK